MLLITTREFERQGDDLNLEDWRAVWGVLEKLENDTDETQSRTEYVGAFNCGVNAGCSQGHKHLQLFPKPVVKKDGWRGLWPEKSLFMGDKGMPWSFEINDDIGKYSFADWHCRNCIEYT